MLRRADRSGKARLNSLLLIVMAAMAAPVPSLSAQEVRLLSPAQFTPLHSIGDVRSLPSPSTPAIGRAQRIREKPFLRRDPEGLRQWKVSLEHAPAGRTPPPPSGPDAAAPAAPSSSPLSIVSSFDGLGDLDNAMQTIPPDDTVAVGPNHVFEMVNGVGRITNKSGVTISTFDLDSFFHVDAGVFATDPMVMYDAASGRWFATYAQSSQNSTVSSSIILAVSTTGDPTEAFCRYRLGNPTTETFVQDFPVVGLSDDKVVVSYDAFDAASMELGVGYYVVNKSALVACSSSPGLGRVAPDSSRFIIFPAQSLGRTGDLFMAIHDVFFDPAALTLLKITGVPGVSPIAETILDLTINPWLIPPNAQQPSSRVRLDTGDDRVLSVAWQNNSLWVAGGEACTPTGDSQVRSCLRVLEVRTDTSTVRQDITYGSAGSYAYYPALRPDGAGNVHVVFTRSSTSEFAGVHVTGRLAADPLNTLQPSQQVRAGLGAQTLPSGRMGDYSGAAVDPSDTSKVWVSGEYLRSTAEADWGTSIAQLSFPAPAPQISLTLNTHTVAPGDLVQVSVTGVNPGGAGVVDVYFAILVPAASGPGLGCPNGDAVAFLANALSTIVVTCASASAQTFPILYQDVSIPAGLPVTVVSDFYSVVWPPGVPPGTYTFAMFFTHPGALADGVIDPGDVIAFGLDSLTFQP